MTWIGPIRLTSIIDFQCRWVSWSTVPHAETPAMFITTSIAGWLAWMSAANRATSSKSEMSSTRCSGTSAPSARASATVVAKPSASRSVRYNSAPWAASFSAVARPIPLAAPVKKQRLPSKPLPCAMAVTLLT